MTTTLFLLYSGQRSRLVTRDSSMQNRLHLSHGSCFAHHCLLGTDVTDMKSFNGLSKPCYALLLALKAISCSKSSKTFHEHGGDKRRLGLVGNPYETTKIVFRSQTRKGTHKRLYVSFLVHVLHTAVSSYWKLCRECYKEVECLRR